MTGEDEPRKLSSAEIGTGTRAAGGPLAKGNEEPWAP